MNTEEGTAFAGSVIDGLSAISEEKRNSLKATLSEIVSRKNNPYLNVALIGDFSSGKSTFINAFIRRELLKTAWAATTAVPTHIYYSDTDVTEIAAEDIRGGRYNLGDGADIERLERFLGCRLPREDGDLIAELSTNNSYSEKIKYIELRVPSFEELKNICIIDTPGVNPGADGTRAHIINTQNTLREYADATIVLFQATNVYKNSFRKFLEENARHFMDDAVFVITMMDIIDEDERGEVTDFVRTCLCANFGLENPAIYACSAKRAASNKSGSEKWREEFDTLRTEIISRMEKRRQNIIENQMSELMRGLMEELDAEVRRDSEDIRRQLEFLENHTAKRLQAELDRNYSEYSEKAERSYANIEKEYHECFDALGRRVTEKIYSLHDMEKITDYIDKTLPYETENAVRELEERAKERFKAARRFVKEYGEKNRRLFDAFSANTEPHAKKGLRQTGRFSGAPVYADRLFDAKIYGASFGLSGLFGSTESRISAAVKAAVRSVERTRAENIGGFLAGIEIRKNAVAAEMRRTEEYFAVEYSRICNRKKADFVRERHRLEKRIRENKAIRKKLGEHLAENDSGTR